MATLFFSCSGKDSTKLKEIQTLSISDVSQFFSPYDYQYFETPLIIDSVPTPSSPDEFNIVIIGINRNEIGGKFPYAGFYWFFDLSPSACQPLLTYKP
ncbi:MAG: hypothetical protein FJ240_10550 [Nitrospira sp.]|nr:hypothetical protein [Nitrospira sp.]